MSETSTIIRPPQVAPARTGRLLVSRLLWADVLALLGVATFLRVWRLGNVPGINGDEAWSGVQAVALAHGESIAWWTPTGNPLNVFFVFPLAALHAVFSPSYVLLRSVAVASGVLAVAVNYWLCRRAFDRQTAVVSTVLLALLPINVAYSRFAWDASQSLLATVLVLYLPLWHYRRRPATTKLPLAAMGALAAAIVVHPTNLFAAPLVVVPIVYRFRHTLWTRAQAVALPAKTWTLAALAAVALAVVYTVWRVLADAAPRARTLGELAEFLANYVKLFSGATVYEYISGVQAASGSAAWFAYLPIVCNTLMLAALVAGGCGMLGRLKHEPSAEDACLALGWFVMLAGFFVVAGPSAIAPHFERYGICLVAPGTLLLARGLGWWLAPARALARAAAWMLALSAWLWPATYYLGYFEFIERTGGRSHMAFRTANVEPKQAALAYITGHGDRRPIRIVASQWWNYWPLAYLALGKPGVQVTAEQPWQQGGPVASDADRAGTQWFVEFFETPADHAAALRAGPQAERHVVFDGSGSPVLSVRGPK